MRHYLREFGVLAILAVLAFVGSGQTARLQSWFGTASSSAGAAVAPQLASQSYVRDETPEGAVSNSVVNSQGSANDNAAVTDGSPTSLFHSINNEIAPQLALHGALVADLETGETYYSLNPNRRWPMASVTKLMTAAYATKYIAGTDQVQLPNELVSYIGEEAATAPLRAGEMYTAQDLVRAMMTFSSNEAAEGLAQYLGRSAFLQGLRDQAASWGMTETSFIDPTGLSASNQSTPNDLRLMLNHLYTEYPQLFSLTRSPSATLTELGSGKKTAYANINQFAGQGDFIGGKTGYTDEAEGNLVSLFAYENRPIAVIVLGTADRFGATSALFNWFKRTHTSR